MEDNKNCTRICAVGGEALMEGIMMRAPSGYSQVVRSPEGKLIIETKRQAPLGAGNKFLNFPVVRGSIRLCDSLYVGMRALFNSAEISATEDDPNYKPTKFDLWIEKHLGDKAMDFIMTISLIISVCLSVGLFFLLPNLIATGISELFGGIPQILYSLTEGVVRIAIFVGYLFLISRMKEIKRVFMYHGAEHKTIHCYEHFEELTVENVRRHSKHHPRCGTAFLFVVMAISIIVHAFFPNFTELVQPKICGILLNLLTRLLSLPIIAGIAYEFNKYAGSHENGLVKVLRAPGLLMQRFTTCEPEDDMIEVAIVALTEALKLEETPDYSAKDPLAEIEAQKAEDNAAAGTENNEAAEDTADNADEVTSVESEPAENSAADGVTQL